MRVSLFVTCLVDQLRPAVGLATVEVLRRAGCEVDFDERQTCCGQPALNTGYREEACGVARHFLDVYADDRNDAIVVPSGSCVAMLRHLPSLFEDAGECERARSVAARTYELSDFLVNQLGVVELDARYEARLAWHDACHGLRELGLRGEPRRLLEKVAGLELVDFAKSESCCGFGGTFSVKYPELSVAMLDQKLQALELDEIDCIASSDVSCLMQIAGRLEKRGSGVRTLHLAEVLAGSD